MVDNDIARHNGFATVGFRAIHTFLTKALNSFAEYIYRLGGCVAAASFFNEFLNFAGYN
jgi:hypothetical protein